MAIDFTSLDQRSALGRIVRMPLKLIPDSAMLHIIQGPLRGRKWIKGSFVNACWLGSYELPEQAWFMRNVKNSMVAWDIGAHVGYYSMLLSKLVGDSGIVYSFEPYCGNANLLLKHLDANKVHNVRVIQSAVADTDFGIAGFMPAPSPDMSHIEDSHTGEYSVPTVSIDTLIGKFRLLAPDVIKMDIEDAELLAIHGAEQLIKQRKTKWVISIHSRKSAEGVYSTFSKAGYVVYDLSGNIVRKDMVHFASDLVLMPKVNAEPSRIY